MMFGLSILVFIIFTIGRSFVIFWICLSSSNSMHKQMTEKVLRAKILFFDSNPIGRIITRFSKDMAVFDMVIPVLAVFVIQGFLRTLTVSITVIVVNPYLIIVVAVCAVLMVFTLKQGKPAMVDGQRLDGQIRAPIHTTFAMIVAGLVTLRAYDKMRYFKQDFNNNLEKCANVTFCYIGANRWLGVRLDMICVLFTITTTLLCVLQKGTQDSALLTLSLQIITDVIAMFSISLRMYAEFENYMTSS
jgi:ATP-binding cassette subfamily C (CFTR/MRP) protein 4